MRNKTSTVWIVVLSLVVAVAVGVTLTIILPPTYDPYDMNQNCEIEMAELMNAIGDWKHGSYDMGGLMTTIIRWKAGSYC